MDDDSCLLGYDDMLIFEGHGLYFKFLLHFCNDTLL